MDAPLAAPGPAPLDPVVRPLSVADNIRSAYHTLYARVRSACRIQLGDAARLGEIRRQALELLQTAEPVSTAV